MGVVHDRHEGSLQRQSAALKRASSHLERPRGGEEEGLAVGRDDAHDGVHVLLKPHIEHPISFVEDCVAHLMREVIRMQSEVQSELISAHQCSSAYVV